jgi:hypothetical protein
MTSLWSRLHWVQQILVVLGISGFVVTLAGLEIINGLSLGYAVLTTGLIFMVVSIFLGWISDGLQDAP